MTKIVLVDMDDVLVDWSAGFKAFNARHYKTKFNSPVTEAWDMSTWLNCSKEESIRRVAEFNSGEHIEFEQLPPTKGSQEQLSFLSGLGFVFHIITCATDVPKAIAMRERNARNLFGKAIGNIHVLPLGADKSPILDRYYRTFWLDDKISNAEDGSKLGHKSYVMNQPHNMNINTHLPRVNDWHEFTRELIFNN